MQSENGKEDFPDFKIRLFGSLFRSHLGPTSVRTVRFASTGIRWKLQFQ